MEILSKIKGEKKHIYYCILAMTVLLLASIWFGYYLASVDPVVVKESLEQTFTEFDFIKNLHPFFIFLFIFLNNVIKGFFVLILGSLFGVIPVLFIFTNGEIIGLVLGISKLGAGPSAVVAGLLPHGILEIPAMIMSASYGLWLGYRFYRFVRFHEEFKAYFSYALIRYLKFIAPVLLLAALIETFVTPYVIEFLK